MTVDLTDEAPAEASQTQAEDDSQWQGEEEDGQPQEAERPAEYDVVDTPPSRCVKCGSTDREPYWNRRVLNIAGSLPSGAKYDRIILRNTVCSNCGQHRVDRSHECRGTPRSQ